ncbi:MAG: HflC protein [Candidatus Omnitrophica bacterium CG11_big_fil_rev_8_21_14_0_20_63_9]|nr:MAG: HflC protein [Candidatus Omnitrophica bacterium CG11_big_fil_rev_8_21_14_0_20_63_9]
MMRAVLSLLPILAVLGILLTPQVCFIVNETDHVIITQFGEYKRTIQQPGLYFKQPVVQAVHRFERRILSSDATPAEYLTLDKKRMVVDHVTRWRITDPLMFFKTVRDLYGARARLDDVVFSELRRAIAEREFVNLISSKREPVMEAVAKSAAVQAKQFGIEIVDVRIKRADLPPEVQQSVFARMVAERERIAKRYRSEGEEEAAKIRAETDKQRTIILAKAYEESQKLRGAGDAEAARITAEAFGQDTEFYRFTRSLETYETVLSKEGQLILSSESELLRYLLAAPAGSSGDSR